MLINEAKLDGQYVVLERLSEDHIGPLKNAVLDGELWKLWYANVPRPDEMERYVTSAIAKSREGNLAYAVRSKNTVKLLVQLGTTMSMPVTGVRWWATLGTRISLGRRL